MVYKIILKKCFQNKLKSLFKYIEAEFGLLIAQKFARLLEIKFQILQQQPFIGQPSPAISEVRSIRAGNTIEFIVKKIKSLL